MVPVINTAIEMSNAALSFIHGMEAKRIVAAEASVIFSLLILFNCRFYYR